jgi:hypothetical protein
MPSSSTRRLAAALAVAFLATGGPAAAQTEYEFEPAVYAIRDARIHPVGSEVLERGTVVLREGMIEALGESVTIPPDAVVVDGTGLTVCPGLIDARTSLMQPAAAAQAASASPGGPPAPRPPTGYSDEQDLLRAERRAADLLQPRPADLETWRAMGFTSALVVPRGHLFLGQSALVNLAGDRAGQWLVRPSVALHVDFVIRADDRSYPSSSMGAIAFVRQGFYDALHHGAELTRLGRPAGAGRRRPEQHAGLEALASILEQRAPVIFGAPRWLDALRALQLARELNLTPVLTGVRDAYRIVPQLQASAAAVVLSLDFPQAPQQADEDADSDSLQTLRDRKRTPETAALLHSAGIPFALTTFGLQNPTDFPKRVATAIERGLPRDAAVAACTLAPAQILGVDSMLGSIAVGKIANLIVTDGELFEPKTKLRYVFVDGRRHEIKDKTAGSDPTAKIELAGTWSISLATDQGEIQITWVVQGTAGSYGGQISAMGMIFPFQSLDVQGNAVTATVDGTQAGLRGTVRFSAVVTGENIVGTVEIPGGQSATMQGTRTSGPSRRTLR